MKLWSLLLLSLVVLLQTSQPQKAKGLELAGEFLIPPATKFAAVGPSRFGALSGLTTLPGGCELLAISDDDSDSRFYRLRLRATAAGIRVEPVQRIPLERASGAPETLDPEGIALTRSGTVLVSSEGIGGAGPRLPPAILEYAQSGRFIRQLPVPRHFIPNRTGPLRTGVRRNGGFESLTATPDFARLFTANELPLVQDGPEDAFSKGQRIRILEYTEGEEGYSPARQFAYELAPLEHPTFATGFSVNGVSELLAVNGTELLVLERGFVQMSGSRLGVNSVRLFRVSLDGATDVSSFDSLAGRDVTPVRKTLVQDFRDLAGLSLRLLNLENFEGLAWVGTGESADRSLLVVSDDNFNALQVTAFLLLDWRTSGSRCAGLP